MVSHWVGKVVKIELLSGKYYKGTVEKDDDNFLEIIDINGNWVTISKAACAFIQEVSQ